MKILLKHLPRQDLSLWRTGLSVLLPLDKVLKFQGEARKRTNNGQLCPSLRNWRFSNLGSPGSPAPTSHHQGDQ